MVYDNGGLEATIGPYKTEKEALAAAWKEAKELKGMLEEPDPEAPPPKKKLDLPITVHRYFSNILQYDSWNFNVERMIK